MAGASFTQSNPLFDLSLSNNDLHSFQPNDLKPAKPRRQCCLNVIVVYLILQTALNAFLLYKIFMLDSALANPRTDKLTSNHINLDGEHEDNLEVLVRNNTQETKNLRGHLWALQSKVSSVCGEDGQLGQMRTELSLLNISTHLLEGKLTSIRLTPGPPGFPGAVGQPGHPGIPGVKGSAGPPGFSGAKGQPGREGQPGPKGDSGAVGPSGQKGDAGLNGQRGAPGDTGPTGPPGPTGSPGPAGPRGPPGIPGVPGNQAKGVKGDKGDPGALGAQGAKGDQGVPGVRGSSGNQGSPGLKGQKGTSGLPGLSGRAGEKGERGLPGARGPPGQKGAKGDRGENAPAGNNLNVRLVPGKYRGRVEVRYNGVWGTVCNDNFDNLDAKVICKMLGFQSVITTYTAIAGSGTIWLDELRCTGRETDIFNCPHSGVGINNCQHVEDVGVHCM